MSTSSNPFIDFELSSDRPKLRPFRSKSILVHVVVNIEAWPFDAPMPRKLLSSPHGIEHVPDVPNFGWVEYGMRCGLPRVFEALQSRSLPASAALNTAVIGTYPSAADLILQANWEIIAHGVTQKSLPAADDESAVVSEAVEAIKAFSGVRPRGWLGPGLAETFETPNVLSAAGFDYLCDWVLDDQPAWIRAAPKPIVSVPYTLEINDSPMYAAQWHPAGEFERRVLDTLEVYSRECSSNPKVLSICLHPHLIGVPHRIAAFERALDVLMDHEDVVFVTGSEICDWYVGERPSL
jgi:allantoinase